MKQHRVVTGAAATVPTLCADFCFMNSQDAEAGQGIPVLVMRDSDTRSLFTHACEGKSTTREGYSSYIIERSVEDIDSVQKDVHLKSDQEPAMLAFQARVQQARRNRTTLKNSPKGDHQANGRAEKGVQVFQNTARRMRLAIEGRLGVRIPHKHPVLMWLIERVGGAHNRFKEGQDDGKTPRERAGWQIQSSVMEFGECIRFVPFQSDARMTKFDAKLRDGIWLGLDGRTDEHIIGTQYGVYRASTIKAVPEDQRWNSKMVLSISGMPWDPTPNVAAEDGARLPDPTAADAEAIPKDGEAPEAIVRKMYIRKQDIEEHGPTPGCIGCRTVLLGKPLQSHTASCRERIETEIRKTEAGRARLDRADMRMTEAIVRESERVTRATPKGDAELQSGQETTGGVRGSTVESAPGADDGSRPPPRNNTDQASMGQGGGNAETRRARRPQRGRKRAVSDQAEAQVRPPQPEPATRGAKRRSQDDDEDVVQVPLGHPSRPDPEDSAFQRPDHVPGSEGRMPASPTRDPISYGPGSSTDRMQAVETPKIKKVVWDSDVKDMTNKMMSEKTKQEMATVRAKLGCLHDVSEIYSPPRVVKMAKSIGMKGGVSLDLTVPSSDGYIWDF